MDQQMDFDLFQPRKLHYRAHYRWYLAWMLLSSLLGIGYLYWLAHSMGIPVLWDEYLWHTVVVFMYADTCLMSYLLYFRGKLSWSIQVSQKGIELNRSQKIMLSYSDVVKVNYVGMSFFYIQMKDGKRWWFSAGIERVDYIWDGLFEACPQLFQDRAKFEKERVYLVQYDHHEKRKDWFFKHRFVDIVNWFILPAMFMYCGWRYQSTEVMIHFEGMYFFRLFMYTLLVLIGCATFYSLILKRFVFDYMVEKRMKQDGEKVRDLEYEDYILQKSKYLQIVTSCFIFAVLVGSHFNFFSLTKVKADYGFSQIHKGKTFVIDNRFNCISCKYQVKDGDLVVFGKGHIGEILARPGEAIAQTRETDLGRTIASETMTVVPDGHVAIRMGRTDSKLVIVKLSELIGKLKFD